MITQNKKKMEERWYKERERLLPVAKKGMELNDGLFLL